MASRMLPANTEITLRDGTTYVLDFDASVTPASDLVSFPFAFNTADGKSHVDIALDRAVEVLDKLGELNRTERESGGEPSRGISVFDVITSRGDVVVRLNQMIEMLKGKNPDDIPMDMVETTNALTRQVEQMLAD
jgi:hypothetical protein